jgi:hypothetical protein
MKPEHEVLIKDIILACCFSHYLMFVWAIGTGYMNQQAQPTQRSVQTHLVNYCPANDL